MKSLRVALVRWWLLEDKLPTRQKFGGPGPMAGPCYQKPLWMESIFWVFSFSELDYFFKYCFFSSWRARLNHFGRTFVAYWVWSWEELRGLRNWIDRDQTTTINRSKIRWLIRLMDNGLYDDLIIVVIDSHCIMIIIGWSIVSIYQPMIDHNVNDQTGLSIPSYWNSTRRWLDRHLLDYSQPCFALVAHGPLKISIVSTMGIDFLVQYE